MSWSVVIRGCTIGKLCVEQLNGLRSTRSAFNIQKLLRLTRAILLATIKAGRYSVHIMVQGVLSAGFEPSCGGMSSDGLTSPSAWLDK